MNNTANNNNQANAVTATTPPDSARDFTSERDSASPLASAYSEQQDRSSADTTPPPHLDAISAANASYRSFGKRYSSNGLSRSYQTAPYATSAAGSVPSVSGFGHFRQLSHDQRPTSSGRNATGQDDRELAAAVELLSCSFGSTTVHLPADAPPVPPLPAQYLDQGILSGGSFINSYPSRAPESFTRGEMRREVDTKMEESGESDDEDMRSRARSDEDDDGVFGRMEE